MKPFCMSHCDSTKVFLASLLIQLQICASLMMFAPPQKYSMPISRKELINELQGLTRKAAQMRSKWYQQAKESSSSNISMKDLLSPKPDTTQESQLLSTTQPPTTLSAESISSFKSKVADVSGRYMQNYPFAGLIHRPSPAEISLGIFNAYRTNFNNFVEGKQQHKTVGRGHKHGKGHRHQHLKEAEMLAEPLPTLASIEDESTTKEATKTEKEDALPAEIETQPSNIRDCLFLRSGCFPTRRLDRARTSAYLDKVQALMTTAP